MAIIKRLTKEQIKKDFTHYAWFYGFVPVYVGDPEGEARIAVRNWIPEFTLDFAGLLFDFFTSILQLVNPDHEPLFFFTITGEIDNGKQK